MSPDEFKYHFQIKNRLIKGEDVHVDCPSPHL